MLAVRVRHIDVFLFGLDADVDDAQRPAPSAPLTMKIGSSAMPSPASAASRIMSPLFSTMPGRPRTMRVSPCCAKRQSAPPRCI
jgi:hypothetical protein